MQMRDLQEDPQTLSGLCTSQVMQSQLPRHCLKIHTVQLGCAKT